MKLVYLGTGESTSDGHTAGHQAYMISYNITVGREYDILQDGDSIWVQEDAYPQGLPSVNGGKTYIGKEYIDLYFKPLSEIRNNKLDTILNDRV